MLILVIINSTRLYLFNNVLLRHRMSIFIIWIWSRRNSSINIQKQPPEVFYKKRCSDKFHKIHRKTPVSESFFNKVAGLRPGTGVFLRILRNFSEHLCYSTPLDDCFRISAWTICQLKLLMKVGCLLNIGIYFNQNLTFLSNINFRKRHVEKSKLE